MSIQTAGSDDATRVRSRKLPAAKSMAPGTSPAPSRRAAARICGTWLMRATAASCSSALIRHRSGTEVCHDPLDTLDVLLVRPIGNNHPRRTPEESSTSRVRSGHLAARHRVCADESRSASCSDDRAFDRRNIDHQCRGVEIRNCSEHGRRRRCEHEQVIGTQVLLASIPSTGTTAPMLTAPASAVGSASHPSVSHPRFRRPRAIDVPIKPVPEMRARATN